MLRKILVMILLLSVLLSVPWSISEVSESLTRAVVFVEKALSLFDDPSAPTFIAAGDWNCDGYVDLLVNGWKLYKNSGPPSFSFSTSASTFLGANTGARMGTWGDLNSDGYLDLFQGCSKGTNDRLWLNKGPPSYEMVDVSSSLFGTWTNMEITTGASWSDMDRDGDLDLYIETGEDWNDGNPIYYDDFILRNDQTMGFTDISVQAGIRPGGEKFYTRGSTWGDFNNDGWSDIYVSHYRISENYLFVNQHDGTFTEEGRTRNCSGYYNTHMYYDATAGSIYGQYWWGPTYGHTIGSSWMDLNRDGDIDVFTSDFVHKYVGYIGSWYDIRGYVCDDGKVYINGGAPDYHFTDYRRGSGIPIWPIGGSGVYRGDQTFAGVTIGDYDSDGWEDIYIPQVYGDLSYTTPHLYRNKGWSDTIARPDGTVFEDVTTSLGIKGSDTYANLFIDYDNDGDLDLLTGGGDTWDGSKWTNYRMRLYQNQGVGANHWLEVKLKDETGNRDAVGARVVLRLTDNGKEQLITREVRAGTGHAHQQPFTLHFGLGGVTSIDRMEIWWPDGNIQEIPDPGIDELLEITHPTEEPPIFRTFSVDDSSPDEDSVIDVAVDCQGDIGFYRWDINSDNHWDLETTSGSLQTSYPTSGKKQIRCRIVGKNGVCTDVYPIEVDVRNVALQIVLSDRSVKMDDPFDLGPGIFKDTPSDMKNISWTIDWGDGVLESGSGPALPVHFYREPGSFYLKLVATDGEVDVQRNVLVEVDNVVPWGYVSPEGGNSTIFEEDMSIEIKAYSWDTVSDVKDRSFRWDLGDGAEKTGWSSYSSIWHSYKKEGTYEITAEVLDSFNGIGIIKGQVNVKNLPPRLSPIIDPIGTITGFEDGQIVLDDLLKGQDTTTDRTSLRYRWDYGDGNISGFRPQPDGSHVYTRSGRYIARCEAVDDDGENCSYPIEVHIKNVPPVLTFEEVPPELWEDEIWTCEPLGSDTVSDRKSLSYGCDLGDGRVLNGGPSFEISYPISGSYEVSLQVMDDDGAMGYANFTLRVGNRPPSGRLVLSKSSAMEDEVIHFTASEISDTKKDTLKLNVSMDLGDGTPRIYQSELDHSYSRSGSFKAKLLISDGDATFVNEVAVFIMDPRPIAAIQVNKTILNMSEVLSFSPSGSYDNPSDFPYLEYDWDFGDGSKASGRSVNHSYEKRGKYIVKLTATDDDGLSDTAQVTIEVKEVFKGKDSGNRTSILLLIAIILLIVLLIVAVMMIAFLMKKRNEATRPPSLPYVQYRYQANYVRMSSQIQKGAGAPNPPQQFPDVSNSKPPP